MAAQSRVDITISKETIEQKRKARQQALAGMESMAGRAIPPHAGGDGWGIELVQ